MKALPLLMACTLTQFSRGNKYHFAVRVGDTHGQFGPFSDPSSILRVEKEGGLFQQIREKLLLSSTDFQEELYLVRGNMSQQRV